MSSFDMIWGQAQTIKSLQNRIQTGRVSHAYIFAGEAGMGKKLMANSFAKTLQCETQGVSSCNRCVSCLAYENGNHPDVFFVRTTKTKSLGTDDIREQVNQNTETKPYLYRHKIFIIEKADTMTIGAQNAILKTLEEPPGFAIFILLVETMSLLLPTIVSRCVTLKFRPLPKGLVREYLDTVLPEPAAEFLSHYAQGNIGKALALAQDEEFINMRTHILNILIQMRQRSKHEVWLLAKELEQYKDRIAEVLDILEFWYRDLCIAKSVLSVSKEGQAILFMPDVAEFVFAEAKQTSMAQILHKLESVQVAARQLRRYANYNLVMDVLLLELTEAAEGETMEWK